MAQLITLYKGKNKKTQQWVYGYFYVIDTLVPFGKQAYITNGKIHTPVDDKTICQYSGLKDKDTQKVFSGDIIELINEDGEVVKVICEFGIARRSIGSIELDIPSFYFKTLQGFKAFPIVKNYAGTHDTKLWRKVGNIHDEQSTTVQVSDTTNESPER